MTGCMTTGRCSLQTSAIISETHSVTLRKLLVIQGMDVKIANRIRHLQSTVPASLPQEEITKEDLVKDWQDAESVASIDTASSSRREWIEDDVALLRNLFDNLPKCPTRQEVRERQEPCADLKELMECNNLERTYNKIKNMLYKKRKR